MKKLFASLIVVLGTASAFAQSDTGVTVITDPARAAAVERHAQMLQARPATEAPAAVAPAAKAPKHHHPHGKSHPKKS
jgi:hypothetical protein